ncbi:MAG: Gfo/Idh/MocA family oxidoreductase [Verrucomicrobia bacterium]|jgi:predicted dehydrogenase|nr:Gfo/Idh/MocA family oxidoreductase [Verrucomicrobiota bacterium]
MNEYEDLIRAAAADNPQRASLTEDFGVAAAYLEHPHIFGQVNGLLEAGASPTYVYDPDPAKVATFRERFPGFQAADSFERILEDPRTRLVTAAGVPSERAAVGEAVLRSGKDYFVDKAPFTTLEQAAAVRRCIRETGGKYLVFYGERVATESGYFLEKLLASGLLGRVAHIAIQGPHKLGGTSRPSWFFDKRKTGGILTDIASHQCDQFLQYGDVNAGEVVFARSANYFHPEKGDWEDYGEAQFRLENGIACTSRVDWMTPDGLDVFGDGRLFLSAEKGTVELRKTIDVGRSSEGEKAFVVDGSGACELRLAGRLGFPFYPRLIEDCVARTERAMNQERAIAAGEMAVRAQIWAGG